MSIILHDTFLCKFRCTKNNLFYSSVPARAQVLPGRLAEALAPSTMAGTMRHCCLIARVVITALITLPVFHSLGASAATFNALHRSLLELDGASPAVDPSRMVSVVGKRQWVMHCLARVHGKQCCALQHALPECSCDCTYNEHCAASWVAAACLVPQA